MSRDQDILATIERDIYPKIQYHLSEFNKLFKKGKKLEKKQQEEFEVLQNQSDQQQSMPRKKKAIKVQNLSQNSSDQQQRLKKKLQKNSKRPKNEKVQSSIPIIYNYKPENNNIESQYQKNSRENKKFLKKSSKSRQQR